MTGSFRAVTGSVRAVTGSVRAVTGMWRAVQRKRQKLLHPWHIALICLVAVGGLVALFPGRNAILPKGQHTDALTVEYLRLLSDDDPADAGLRLDLAERLLGLGRLDEARKIVAQNHPAGDDLKVRTQVLLVRIELAAYQARAARLSPAAQKEALAHLAAAAQDVLRGDLPVAELAPIAELCQAINRNDLAAGVYDRLAQADPPHRGRWLRSAAKSYLASGKPAQAALIYERLALDPAPAAGDDAATAAASDSRSDDKSIDKGDDKPDKKAHRHRPPRGQGQRRVHGRRPVPTEQARRQRPRRGQQGDGTVGSGHPAGNGAAGDSEPRRDALLALQNFLAASATLGKDAVVQHATRAVTRFPDDPDILRAAIRLAQSQNATDEARRWGRMLLALRPDSAEENQRQAALELAAGDPKTALPLLERTAALRPLTDAEHEQFAKVAEWADKPKVALQQWAHLARRHPRGPAMDQALRLAPELRDFVLQAELLALKAQQGKLADIELIEMVHVHEDIGKPEDVCFLLLVYLEQHPEQVAAWKQLAIVQEHRGELLDALATLTRVAPRLQKGELLENARDRAQLLWRLHRPEDAFVLLSGVVEKTLLPRGATNESVKATLEQMGVPLSDDHPGGEDGGDDEGEVAPLTLLGQLLAAVEGDKALPLYRQLFSLRLLRKQEIDHYLGLEEHLGSERAAIAAARVAYGRFGEAEFLLHAMDLAEEGEQYDTLRQMVREAEKDEARFAGSKDYWLLKAAVAEREELPTQARAAYEHALRLDPDSETARLSLLELLIDQIDRETDRQDDRQGASAAADEARAALGHYLRRWARRASETAFHLPMATAYAQLGQPQLALRWYEREWRLRRPDKLADKNAEAATAQGGQDDGLWLFEYAGALDQAGRRQKAQSVRRLAIQLVHGQALAAAARLRKARAAGRPAGQDREFLQAYTAEVRNAYGPGRGRRWLVSIVTVSPDLLAVWRGPADRPAAVAASTGALGAVGDGDKEEEEGDSEDDASEESEARTQAALPAQEVRRFVAHAGLRGAPRDEPPARETTRIGPRGRDAEDEQLPARYWTLTGDYRFDALDDLGVHTAAAAAELARPSFTLRLDAHYAYLYPWQSQGVSTESFLVPKSIVQMRTYTYSLQSGNEADFALSGTYRYRIGHLDAAVGLNLMNGNFQRSGTPLSKDPAGCLDLTHQTPQAIECPLDADQPYFLLGNDIALFPGTTLALVLHLNEIVNDSPGLRYFGAHDGVSLDLDVNFTKQDFVRAQLDLNRYHDRRYPWLDTFVNCAACMGQGYAIEAEIGHRFRQENPEWDIHIETSWIRNYLNQDYLPPYWQGEDKLPDPVPSAKANGGLLTTQQQQQVLDRPVYDLLASTYYQLGLETSLHRGTPGKGPAGRYHLRYDLEAWFGWLHSTQEFTQPNAKTKANYTYQLEVLDAPGFDLRGSLGLALPRGQELSVTAYVNNNRPLGQGLLYWGTSLRYLF